MDGTETDVAPSGSAPTVSPTMKPPVPTVSSGSASPLRESGGKHRTWLIVVPIVLFTLIAAYMAWDNLYGASAKKRAVEQQDREQTERLHQYLKNFEDAMRADTYGGSTPEETLQLFIVALKAGDIDLASRYFALETNENSPDYLTRTKITKELNNQKSLGTLPRIISLLEKVESDSMNSISGDDASFILKENGAVISEIDMQFNTFSHVWKIQSM